MAPLATNGNAMAVSEEIQAPPAFVLPKEIKGASPRLSSRTQLTTSAAILEKTAGYVARNRIVFEGPSLPSCAGWKTQLTIIDRI